MASIYAFEIEPGMKIRGCEVRQINFYPSCGKVVVWYADWGKEEFGYSQVINATRPRKVKYEATA